MLVQKLPSEDIRLTETEPFTSDNERFISIVDDELDITELFSDALCQNVVDASVITFNDSVKALEHFTENKNMYALVISDLRMPNLTGLELLKKVKEQSREVRTVLISAFEVDRDPAFQQYVQDGIINNFMKKPIRVNSFCREVNDQMHAFRTNAQGKT
jgi:DNA-binding NtrC family response regulator